MNYFSLELFWRNALIAIPLTLGVMVLCRCAPLRPSTKHALWLIAMLSLLAPPTIPGAGLVRDGAANLGARVVAIVDDMRSSAGDVVVEPGAPAARDSDVNVKFGAPLAVPNEHRIRTRARVDDQTMVDRAPAPLGKLALLPHVSELTDDLPAASFVEPERLPGGAHRRITRRSDWLTAPLAKREPAPVEVEIDYNLSTGLLAPTPTTPGVADRVAIAPKQRVARVGDGEANKDRTKATGDESGYFTAFARPEVWRSWGAKLGAIRDEAMTLPPIPPMIWLFGAVIALAMASVRMARFRRMLAKAVEAPACVQALVEETARELKMRKTPDVVLVEAPTPPMLWCGARRLLILPAPLWEQLNDDAQRAIVLHELAHLKRRDHWVCWLELLIAGLYWWHPAVWLIRRRLHEEADICCDAWVTSVAPQRRRAYAHALLWTRTYLSDAHRPLPAVGLGVMTGRAHKFGRRLTMVLTQETKPRMSFRGLLATGLMSAIVLAAAPALACNDQAKAPECEKEKSGQTLEKNNQAPADDATTFERHLRGLSAAQSGLNSQAPARLLRASDDHGNIDARLSRLEERLDVLARALEKVGKGRGGAVYSQAAPGAQGRSGVRTAKPAPPAPPAQMAPRVHVGDGGLEVRSYELPADKLKALTKLMSRDDVPILIEPGDGAIKVHATHPQHMVFNAFVTMINQEDQKKPYQLSDGKLDAMTELMVLNTVPILVSPGDEAIVLHGTDLEQLIFGAFVQMIDPDKAQARDDRQQAKSYVKKAEELARAQLKKERNREVDERLIARQRAAEIERALKSERRVIEQKARELGTQRKMLEREMHELDRKREKLEREASQLERQAERLHRQAQALQERAASTLDEVGEVNGERRLAMIAEAEELAVHAAELSDQAAELEEAAERIEFEAEDIEREAELREEAAEQIEEAADDMEERWEDLEEQYEEALEEIEDEESEEDEEAEESIAAIH